MSYIYFFQLFEYIINPEIRKQKKKKKERKKALFYILYFYSIDNI